MSVDVVPRVVVVHDDVLVCDVVEFACRRQGLSPTVVHDFASLLGPIRAARGAGPADPDTEAGEAAGDRPIDPERPDVVVCADVVDGVAVEDVLDRLTAGRSRVLILASDPASDRLTAMLSLDVAGCLSLDARFEDIARGIFAAARGEVALDATALNLVVSQWRRLRAQPVSISSRRRALTSREHEIVLAMAEGLSAKDVACRLGVALKTIENHKIRIFEKLGVRSQAHAVTVAMAYGLAPRRPPAAAISPSKAGEIS